jgi:Protein of unknown function (DUF669)
MGIEDLGTLDLTGADLSAGDFEPIPAASYEMHVHEVNAVEVEHDNGKLPMGTPGWNIQFRVDGGKYDNRVVFKRFYIPGPDYDAEKRKKSLGIFTNFILAMGYPKDEVMSGAYSVDPEDWKGKQVKVSVRIRPAQRDEDGEVKYPAQNEVTSIKALTPGATGASAGVL